MRRALIGYTGFVGSNLDRQQSFTHRYNSSNIDDIRGKSFDEIVCAGIQAVKWWANKNPLQDRAGIDRLLGVLSTVQDERFTLISTVDVYKTPVNVNENTAIEIDGLHSYGMHRLQVEHWVRERFPKLLIVRLPGLFGMGLKKNLIFDVLEGKDLSGFHKRSCFQFYDLERIAADLEVATANGLSLLNVAVEPVSVADVVLRVSGDVYGHTTENPPLHYAMQSIHAGLWGREGQYISGSQDSLERVARFAHSWRSE